MTAPTDVEIARMHYVKETVYQLSLSFELYSKGMIDDEEIARRVEHARCVAWDHPKEAKAVGLDLALGQAA